MKLVISAIFYAVSVILIGSLADEYFVEVVGIALLFGLFAASVDFSWGRAGILTLGAALYFGIGAYAVGFGYRIGLGFWPSVGAGIATALVVSVLIGVTALRVRASTVQFGLTTLIASLSAQQLTVSLYNIAGGSNGISGIAKPQLNIYGHVVDLGIGDRYFFVVSSIAFLGVAFLRWLASSHFGRLALCVRESDERVAAFGYNPKVVKLVATMITAIGSSLAGALLVSFNGIAEPELFAIRPNMLVLVWVAMGGQGTLVGPFVTAALLQIIQFELGSQFENVYLLIVGLLFVVSVRLFGSGGLPGAAIQFWRRVAGSRRLP